MEIERAWHKWPGWYESLPRTQQVDIMADYILTTEERKRAARRTQQQRQASRRKGG